MSLLDSRQGISASILEGRFIRSVLSDTTADIDKAQRNYMSSRGFESGEWYSGRSFMVSNNSFDYVHLKKHRFVDMKVRNSKKGRNKQKQHRIHNRILWQQYNNVIKEMHFGFTEAVKNKLREMDNQNY